MGENILLHVNGNAFELAIQKLGFIDLGATSLPILCDEKFKVLIYANP